MQRQAVGDIVPDCDMTARLQRDARIPSDMEFATDHMVGLGKRAFDIAHLAHGVHARERVIDGDVVFPVRVDDRGVQFDGGLDIDNVVEHLVIDIDEGQRVLGHITAVGHDRSNRLAHVAHLVAREGRRRRLFLSRKSPDRREVANAFQVGGSDHEMYAFERHSLAGVDGLDRGMCKRATEYGHVHGVGGGDVSDEAAAPSDEHRILASCCRLSDPGGGHFVNLPFPTQQRRPTPQSSGIPYTCRCCH